MRAENHEGVGTNPRRQGNQIVRSPVLTTGKGKQIADDAEGTGSNDLLLNETAVETKKDKWNDENNPPFAPHDFFNREKTRPFEEGEQSAERNTNDTVQGTARLVSNNLKRGDVNKHSSKGNSVDGQQGRHTSLNQNENTMLLDEQLLPNGSASENKHQDVESEQPVFADTIAGTEAREYYWLEKMNLPDTFDHDDLERYFSKQNEEKSRFKAPATDSQLIPKKDPALKTKDQQVRSTSQKVCNATPSVIESKEVLSTSNTEKDIVYQMAIGNVSGTKENVSIMNGSKKPVDDKMELVTTEIEINLIDVMVTDASYPHLGGKRKNDTNQKNSTRNKKQRNGVDREASSKWLPSSK